MTGVDEDEGWATEDDEGSTTAEDDSTTGVEDWAAGVEDDEGVDGMVSEVTGSETETEAMVLASEMRRVSERDV